MDKIELEVAMLRAGVSVAKLADITGMNKTTIYRKLDNGKFDRSEIMQIRDALGLTDADLLRIFFSGGGCENSTPQNTEGDVERSERTETV